MTNVLYDYAIDMSESTAFSDGYVDREGGYLYLVFRESGSIVSHVIPDWLDDATIESVESWGQLWNNHLKHTGDRGPEVHEWLDEFVQRGTEDAEPVEEPTVVVESAVQADTIDVDRVMQVFVQRLTDSGWIVDNDADRDFRAALTEALGTIPTVEVEREVTILPEDSQNLAEAVRNSSGTFLGLGFVDVPAEQEHTLHSLLVSFNQFARENVPGVESHIERYNVDAMRAFMGGLR